MIQEFLLVIIEARYLSNVRFTTWSFCLDEVLKIQTTLNEDLYLKSYVLKALMGEYSFLVDEYIEQI